VNESPRFVSFVQWDQDYDTPVSFIPRACLLLERLRTEFDMILIDAPPMIWLADARVLAASLTALFRAPRRPTTHESAYSPCNDSRRWNARTRTFSTTGSEKQRGYYGYKDCAGMYVSTENKLSRRKRAGVREHCCFRANLLRD